jgi:hypothetical protein
MQKLSAGCNREITVMRDPRRWRTRFNGAYQQLWQLGDVVGDAPRLVAVSGFAIAWAFCRAC